VSEAAWVIRPTVPRAAPRRLADAAAAEATDMRVPVTVVIVDESGVLKELCRMDGAPLVSVQTAMSKAYAAAAIAMPPDEFYTAIEADGAAVASFAGRPGMALTAGGLPLLADGQLAGAIGIAGGDDRCRRSPDRESGRRCAGQWHMSEGRASNEQPGGDWQR
jgi:glc operon protein GlcG